MIFYKHQFITVDRTLELYFAGCTYHCPGCQNEFLWDKSVGEEKTPEQIISKLLWYVPVVKQVHILGGEPLQQDMDEMKILLDGLKDAGFKNITVFTGNDYENISDEWKAAIKSADYLKCGGYKSELPNTEGETQINGLKLASLNQKVYKI